MPRFTIITVCYNAEDSVSKTVESVLGQTSKNFEYIIVDGASTDRTFSILNEYQNPVMHVYSEPDQGISDAFNKGIVYSKGDYLLFLNSGDYFLSQDILENVEKDTEIYCEDVLGYSTTSIIRQIFPESIQEGNRLWEDSLIPHQGCFIKRKVFTRVGDFNLYFKVRMDYDFFSRCYLEGITYRCIPCPIVYYDSSGISSTDTYHSAKEGMAVRLLYHDQVGRNEHGELEYLVGTDEGQGTGKKNELAIQRNLADKHFKIMMVMRAWIMALQKGKRVVQSLYGENNQIAIYGWGYLGKCLENELRIAGIGVKYIIDREKKEKAQGIEVYGWDDTWPDVDIIVVTPFYEFQQIKNKLKERTACKIISIEEIVMGQEIK